MNQPQTETTPDIDLDNLDPRALCNAGAWVPLKVGSIPAGLDIKIRGRFSDVFEKISRQEQRKIQAEFKLTKEFALPDPVDANEKKLDLIVACAIDWRGKNAKVPFSADALRALLVKHPQFVEQLDKAIVEDGRFLTP